MVLGHPQLGHPRLQLEAVPPLEAGGGAGGDAGTQKPRHRSLGSKVTGRQYKPSWIETLTYAAKIKCNAILQVSLCKEY